MGGRVGRFRAVAALAAGAALAWAVAATAAETAAGEGAAAARAAEPDLEDDPLTSPRTAWFREAKFGMFIHWGIYAVPAGVYRGKEVPGIGEWIMDKAKIPVDEYEKFAAQFNPVRFDAREWVRVARDAGMKYVVITSKHHDGFSMFDTKLTDYSVVKAAPWRHDPMKDLAAACREAGLRFCFYYSIMDWHHPDQNGDFPKYVEYMKGQLRELVTQYGPLGILWFDGEWINPWDERQGADLYAYVRGLQPDLIVNNRVGKRKATDGDYETPEQTIPAGAIRGRLWETCMTLNNTRGFKTGDHAWKPASDLVRKLVDIASKGGNFLLNVGPTAQGVIPPESVQRLEEVGRWMKANGASVYGTTAGPWKKPPFDGRGTVKGTTLYVHVFNWPDGPLSLAGLKGNVRKAEALDPAVGEVQGGAPAGDVQTLTLQRPWRPDPIDTVVAVEFREAPSVDEAVAAASPAMPAAPAVAPAAPAAPGRQAADGSIVLRAADATVHGNTAKYEANKDCVGFWTNAGDWVSWDVTVDKPGVFVVEVTYAADKGCGGAKYVVSMGRSGLTGQTRKTGSLAQFSTETSETGSWTQYRTDKLGPLKIQEAGKVTISVKAISKPGLGVMNLRAVELKPVND